MFCFVEIKNTNVTNIDFIFSLSLTMFCVNEYCDYLEHLRHSYLVKRYQTVLQIDSRAPIITLLSPTTGMMIKNVHVDPAQVRVCTPPFYEHQYFIDYKRSDFKSRVLIYSSG